MRRSTRLLARFAALAVAAGTLFTVSGTPAQAVAGTELWKVDCTYSHSAADDPIVLPGQPGASHLHDFFGNISTNAYSTYESMDGVTSTCVHGDRGAYWTPTLYRNGKAVHPDGVIVYYTTTAYDEPAVEAFPPDFKMIVGNKNATTAAEATGKIYWGCHDNSQISYTRREPPTDCGTSNGIQLRVEFPSCWDGVAVAGNAIDHLRFPSSGNCPAGFPHVFPRIGFHATYKFDSLGTGDITFSSGNVYSAHLDFWNTWDQDVLQALIDNCSNAQDTSKCGHFTAKNTGAAGSPGRPAPPVTTATATTAAATTPAATASSAGPMVTRTATTAPVATGAPTPAPTTTTTAPVVRPRPKHRSLRCLYLWHCH